MSEVPLYEFQGPLWGQISSQRHWRNGVSSKKLEDLQTRKVDVRLPEKREFTLAWREAGPPNHDDNKVVSDQEVVNKELSLCGSRPSQ